MDHDGQQHKPVTDTATGTAQRYEPVTSVQREHRRWWFGVVWFAMLLPLLIWLGWRMPSGVGQIVYFPFVTLLALLVLYTLRREWRHGHGGRENCALLADDDGLWPAHLAKTDALVRWGHVDDAVYELGPAPGALILLDKGRRVLRIDRRLAGYETLCAQVFQRMRRPIPALPSIGLMPKTEMFFRWVVPVASVSGTVFFWVWEGDGAVGKGLAGLLLLISIVFVLYGPLMGLSVDEKGVSLIYSGFRSKVTYAWDEIADVALQMHSVNSPLCIKLLMKNGQSVVLRDFSGDSRSHYKENQPFPCMDGYRLIRQRLGLYVKTPAIIPAVPPHPPAASTTN